MNPDWGEARQRLYSLLGSSHSHVSNIHSSRTHAPAWVRNGFGNSRFPHLKQNTTTVQIAPAQMCQWGLKENTNCLLRRYLPKGSTIGNLMKRAFKHLQLKINSQARKAPIYLSSCEHLSKKHASLMVGVWTLYSRDLWRLSGSKKLIIIEIKASYFSNTEEILHNDLSIDVIESSGFDGKRSLRLLVEQSKHAIANIKKILNLVYQKDIISEISITKDKVTIGKVSATNLEEVSQFISSIQKQLETNDE